MTSLSFDGDAVTSIFDADDTNFIKGLSDELLQADLSEARFANFIPHITYTALKLSDYDGVATCISEIAAQTPPFILCTTGIGVFTGELLVLHLHFVRMPQLNRLQRELSEALAPFAVESNPNFMPSNWLPHLTLGWPKGADELGQAVKRLCQRDLRREFAIDNITILFHDEAKSPQRFDLKG
jgi:2'-5' RNA ligase